jgi:acyl dehydratase
MTAEAVEAFATLSGDWNPLHVSTDYAATTVLQRPIAHGMLLGAFVSRLVGMYLPGRRSLWVSSAFDFVDPVYPGDLLKVTGEIASKHEAVSTVVVKVQIKLHSGQLALRGKAVVKLL